MNELKALKCPSCGSSSIEKNNLTSAKCSYCGSVFQLQPGQQTESRSNAKPVKYTVLLSGLLLVVIIFMRINSSPSHVEIPVTNSNTVQNPIEKVPVINLKSNIPEIKTKNLVITDKDIENTEMKPNVSVTKEISSETSIGGKYWIVTIKNEGKTNVARPGALVSIFNSEGQRIEEQKGWAKYEHLAPGQETEVLVLISKPPRGDYKTEITGFAQLPGTYDTYQDVLEVQNFVVKKENKYSSRVSIIGDVLNSKEYQVDYVTVIALAKNQQGNVVGIADGYVSNTSIPPGEQSGFKVSAGTYISETPASWSLYALGKKHRNMIQ